MGPGERRDTASRGTPGACPAPFRGPGFHYLHPIPNSSQRPRGWVEKADSWRAAGMAAHSETQPSKPSISAQESGIHHLNSTQGLRLSKAPSWGSQQSQFQRLPRTKASEPSIPKTQASGPSFLCPVNQVSEFSPSKDPDICAPQCRPGTQSPSPLPILPGTRVSGSSRATGPQGGGTHGSGADPGTGGLPPAPAPAAGSGGRGGAGAGNRLDDETPAGGRRVPEWRGS